MDIEQKLPDGPKTGLVFALAGATLLVFLLLAYLFVDFTGGHLTFRHHSAHPTSQLMPEPSISNPTPATYFSPV